MKKRPGSYKCSKIRAAIRRWKKVKGLKQFHLTLRMKVRKSLKLLQCTFQTKRNRDTVITLILLMPKLRIIIKTLESWTLGKKKVITKKWKPAGNPTKTWSKEKLARVVTASKGNTKMIKSKAKKSISKIWLSRTTSWSMIIRRCCIRTKSWRRSMKTRSSRWSVSKPT